MARVVNLEQVEAEREKQLGGYNPGTASMMAHPVERRLGRRPVGGTFNQALLARSPGSSQHHGLDFVKACYAERTGQE
jgi:hypothetical protein